MNDFEGERAFLRPGRPEDHPAFVRLFEEFGLEEPAPPLETWLSELVKRSFFVEGPEGVSAYALVDVMGRTGHVAHLVVAPGQRRRGLGARVMRALADDFRQRGCLEWMLHVKPDNVAALALYTALGMRVVRTDSDWRLTREHLEALPLAPESLEVVPVEAREFDPLTRTFGLVPGQLARYAEQRGVHRLLRLRDPEHPEAVEGGWMDLRPSWGLIIPFHAASLAHARALLEAAFLELGTVSSLRVVTGDEPLGDCLHAAGAQFVMRTRVMKGSLGADPVGETSPR